MRLHIIDQVFFLQIKVHYVHQSSYSEFESKESA